MVRGMQSLPLHSLFRDRAASQGDRGGTRPCTDDTASSGTKTKALVLSRGTRFCLLLEPFPKLGDPKHSGMLSDGMFARRIGVLSTISKACVHGTFTEALFSTGSAAGCYLREYHST